MAEPLIRFERAAVSYGSRTIWRDLSLDVYRGEFLAVLGPNGSGKTTLLKVLLGIESLSAGRVEIGGVPPRHGNHDIGYVPQHRHFDRELAIRGKDLVRFGLDGHRPGLPFTGRRTRQKIDAVIAAVGATSYANAPIGLLSGGEQQRLRIAQALLGDPRIFLCDEPLLSLDLAHQAAVTELIDERRRLTDSAVVFVTHEINPILPYVDRVLYLVKGRSAVGTPEEVLTADRLSDLYGTRIEVLRTKGRIVVVGTEEKEFTEPSGHHHHARASEEVEEEETSWA